jgi:hypothetical protein
VQVYWANFFLQDAWIYQIAVVSLHYNYKLLKFRIMKNKLTVGQKLWLSLYRKNRKEELKEVTVATVSNKYFTIEEMPWDKFAVDGLYHVTPNGAKETRCFLSKQDYEDREEADKIHRFLSNYFDYRETNLTIDQLRRIKAIIEE